MFIFKLILPNAFAIMHLLIMTGAVTDAVTANIP